MDISELRIYKLSAKLRDEIHEEIKKIPNHKFVPDVVQIERSSSSVAANIAEGYGTRFYTKRFLNYLNIAIASSDETQNHVGTLLKDGYFTKEKSKYFINAYKDLSIRTVNYRNYHYKKSLTSK